MPRKTPNRHKVRTHSRRGRPVQSYFRGKGYPHMRRNVSPRVVGLVGTPDNPLILLDENISPDVEYELRDKGYRTIHVTKIFKKGTPDNELTKYVEEHKAIIVTRDTFSFPEPRTSGDRIVVRDLPKMETVDEIVIRLRELGIKPGRRIR